MNWQKYNNPAGYIAFSMILFNLLLAGAYFLQKDFRRALYFLFAAAITCTVVL